MSSRLLRITYILFFFSFLTTYAATPAEYAVPGDTVSDNNDLSAIRISLLTCGTGTAEVYQAFGHTAIRVHNKETGEDDVYNYGMFDFNTDGFLMKFIRGKLLYFVAAEDMEGFMFDYHYHKRWVREQDLDLDNDQKAALIAALRKNILYENRYYLYDFIYNNCSTQPRDLIRNTLGPEFKFTRLATENTETIREMVDRHVRYNEWLDFGIDLLLGVRFDKVADADTRMFLPAELMTEFDSTQFMGKPIVSDSRILYSGGPQPIPNIPGPTLIFWSLLFIMLFIQIIRKRPSERRWASVLMLLIAGIVGMILTFMWFGTDHYMTKWNLNLLWAFPLHAVMAFFLLRKEIPPFVMRYFECFRILMILLILGWCINPQQFHAAVLPIMLILILSIGRVMPIPKESLLNK